MLRGWLLGLFVVGLTAFYFVRGYFESQRPDAAAAQVAEVDSDRAVSSDPAELEMMTATLLSDLAPAEALEPAEGSAQSDPVDGEDLAPKAAEPVEASAAAIPAAAEISEGEPTRPVDLDQALDYQWDVPGGATEADRELLQQQAFDWIRQAKESSSPVEVARYLSQAILSGGLSEAQEDQAYEGLLAVNRRGLLNPRHEEECFRRPVRSGDSLWTICRRLQSEEGRPPVAPGLIRLVNGMKSDVVHPGDRLKIPLQPLRIVAETSRYRLYVLVGDLLIRRYHVGLGKVDAPTPIGVFEVKTREKEPTWYKPGYGPMEFGNPENVLGTRWLGFKELPDFPNADTYGVHGTWDDDSIGGNFSNGCIRMHNSDVEELFEFVAVGTTVEIRG